MQGTVSDNIQNFIKIKRYLKAIRLVISYNRQQVLQISYEQ